MGILNKRSVSDLRGALRLATEATVGVTDLVEKMHHTIELRHPPLGASRAESTSGLTGFIYNSIRGTTKLVGQGLDVGLAPFSALLPEQASVASRDAIVSAINGVYGDHLVETGNPLAIKMKVLHAGQMVDIDQPAMVQGKEAPEPLSTRLMLFIHGLCLNEGHWARDGINQGLALATDLGYTPLYLRYNTGLPIADNGIELAALLERLLANWPQPVTELVFVGHSMGGLLARSTCHHADEAGHEWLQHLRKMVFIGSPHHGAPLERGGDWLDSVLELSPYVKPFTRIAKKRSAGITDLRHGSVTSEQGNFVALPQDVACYAVAAMLGKKHGRPGGELIGDGLVPLDSALGRGKNQQRTLAIPDNHQWVGFETGHMGLLTSSGVYTQLRNWL